MKISNALAGAAVAALGLTSAANASYQTVYSNPYVFGAGGDCAFNTVCSAALGVDDYAAQEFTLTKSAVVLEASFTELDLGTVPTAANWGFALADGAGGLPGTLLSAGTDSIDASVGLGTDGPYNVSQIFFGVGPQALGPGTYYFAVQAVSTVPQNFLGSGAATSGAAETQDGGVTWTPGYESRPSVAIALYAVPEPSAWILMLVGVWAVGAAMRRRAAGAATVAQS